MEQCTLAEKYLQELKDMPMQPLDNTDEAILKELRRRKAKHIRDQQTRKHNYSPRKKSA